MTSKFDITINKGSDYIADLELVYYVDKSWKDLELQESEVFMQIRETYYSDNVVLDLSESKFIRIEDNLIKIHIPGTSTQSLEDITSGVYDIKLRNIISGIETRILEGKVMFKDNVTRIANDD